MYELARVLATESADPVLPMELVGWGTLALSLLVTLLWTVYVYR